jgi:HlyD family secretion protein
MAVDHIPELPRRRAWSAAGAIAVATAVVMLAASSVGGPSVERASAQESPSSASSKPGDPSSIPRSSAVALARLLPSSGLITVGARPGVRVEEIKVKAGDQVSPGTVLAILEGHEAARLQLDLAEARKKRADEEWTARLDAARKAAEITIPRRDEARRLYNTFGATLKGKDRYDADMALYQVEMQAIRAELDLRLLGGTLPPPASTKGSATEKSPPAPHNPEAAAIQAQVDLAAAGLRDTEIRATGTGRVLKLLVLPGELSAGALLQMGDVSSMVARAEVYQSDVPRIRPGDPAEVDILGSRVGGKVTRIGSIVGKNQLTSIDPRAMRDLRVVEVTIQLDQAEPAARYVDMEVEAVIRPSGASASASRSTSQTRDPRIADR